MEDKKKEFELIDYWNIVWKRKWLIIIPTFICVLFAVILSFKLTPIWEVEFILEPSKYFMENNKGLFEEISVMRPKKIAALVREGAYHTQVATDLQVKLTDVPDFNAESIEDTKLVRVSLKGKDVKVCTLYLNTLWKLLKKDFNHMIDLKFKDTENEIKQKELTIAEHENKIKLNEIEISKFRQKITSSQRKSNISREKVGEIQEDIGNVKKGNDNILKQYQDVLSKNISGNQAVSLLLYSNVIQQNIQYLSTLKESLTLERINQENLNIKLSEYRESIKVMSTNIETEKSRMDKINNEIQFLKEKKERVSYADLTQEPRRLPDIVFPRKKLMVLVALLLSLAICIMIAFFLDYFERKKQ